MVSSNGTRYTGDWKDDLKDGDGKILAYFRYNYLLWWKEV